NDCYNLAKQKLSENKDKLDLLAARLIEKETLDVSEVRELLGFEADEEDISASSDAQEELRDKKTV
ncbi:MAG: cell division protein FtsH, partial [Candidatus Omnitrophica bacterium]|nr:cell division protein FtsH [Candidatus Omnitrophota bacterium]